MERRGVPCNVDIRVGDLLKWAGDGGGAVGSSCPSGARAFGGV